MKLAIIGYGKMGKEIEKTAIERGHKIGAVIDTETDWINCLDQFKSCDVAIEFSLPQVAPSNIVKCFDHRIPVVSGTTGWTEHLEEIVSLCYAKNGALFHASNFSVGVNIFFEINRRLAEIMNKHQAYDVSLSETHHIQKLDSPSGTAISLANDILSIVDRKTSWVNYASHEKDLLDILSFREDQVPGTHEVLWKSDIDSITIRHKAKNRKGFAIGAVMAAEFLPGKHGFFGMKHLLNL
jgi:4-hydroxy-tetrahydrodipicolinate reductase